MASKTFLTICQDLRQEAGVSGNGPVSVTGQVGELARLVNWVKKAYLDIQNKYVNWQFLRQDVQFNTVVATSTYSAASAGIANFGEWIMSHFRAYTTSVGIADEQRIIEISWDAMHDTYLVGPQRTQTGRPVYVAQKPDQSLIFWPVPDAIYTVVGEMYRAPADFAANTDVPLFPAKYHDMIAWRALMFYAAQEGAPELYATGEREYKRLLSKMEATQLPQIVGGEPMA